MKITLKNANAVFLYNNIILHLAERRYLNDFFLTGFGAQFEIT